MITYPGINVDPKLERCMRRIPILKNLARNLYGFMSTEHGKSCFKVYSTHSCIIAAPCSTTSCIWKPFKEPSPKCNAGALIPGHPIWDSQPASQRASTLSDHRRTLCKMVANPWSFNTLRGFLTPASKKDDRFVVKMTPSHHVNWTAAEPLAKGHPKGMGENLGESPEKRMDTQVVPHSTIESTNLPWAPLLELPDHHHMWVIPSIPTF